MPKTTDFSPRCKGFIKKMSPPSSSSSAHSSMNAVLNYAIRIASLRDVKAAIERGAEIQEAYNDILPLDLARGHSAIHRYLSRLIERDDDDDDMGTQPSAPQAPILPPLRLIEAVKEGNLERISKIIDAGVNLETKDAQKKTALVHAVCRLKIDVVRILLSAGADVYIKDIQDNLLSHLSRFKDKIAIEIMKLLLEKGISIDATNSSKFTALHEASRYKNYDVVKFLLENGAGIEEESRIGKTPLFYAVESGAFEIVKLLLEKGACITSDVDFYTRLKKWSIDPKIIKLVEQYRITEQNTKLLLDALKAKDHKLFIQTISKNKIDIKEFIKNIVKNVLDEELNYLFENILSPLYVKSINITDLITELSKNPNAIKILLKHGVSVDSVDKHGNSLLMLSVMNANTDLAKILLSCGANINIINTKGEKALSIASKFTCSEMHDLISEHSKTLYSFTPYDILIKKLQDEGGDPYIYAFIKKDIDFAAYLIQKKLDPSLAFMHAVRHNLVYEVNWLLKNGVNPDIVIDNSIPPFFYAVNKNNIILAQLLLHYGVNINITKNGCNAMCYAASPETVKWLLKKGIEIDSTDNDGNTVLMKCIALGKIEMVKVLLEHGANLFITNKVGKTALNLAQEHPDSEIAKLVLEHSKELAIKSLLSLSSSSSGVIEKDDDDTVDEVHYPRAPKRGIEEVDEEAEDIENAQDAKKARSDLTAVGYVDDDLIDVNGHGEYTPDELG